MFATARAASGAPEIDALGADARVWKAPDELPEPGDFGVAYVLFPPRGVAPTDVARALAGVPRVVYCSSTSVYGDQQGGPVDEDTPVAPLSPWGRARVEAEEALRGQGAVIVRAAGIYGPGRNIVERLRAGRVRVTGDLDRPVNLIHVEDLATILIAAAERGVPGTCYLAASGRPISWQALIETASALSGIGVPAPTPMPSDPNLGMFYRESKRCAPKRLAELGVTLAHPDVREALRGLAP